MINVMWAVMLITFYKPHEIKRKRQRESFIYHIIHISLSNFSGASSPYVQSERFPDSNSKSAQSLGAGLSFTSHLDKKTLIRSNGKIKEKHTYRQG